MWIILNLWWVFNVEEKKKEGREKECIIVTSVMIEMFYISIVQCNSHQPNVGNYHLKYGLSNLIEALVLI